MNTSTIAIAVILLVSLTPLASAQVEYPCYSGNILTLLSGTFAEFTGVYPNGSAFPGSMGKPGMCQEYGFKYCVAYPRVRCIPEAGSKLQPTTRYAGNCEAMPYMPSYGFCVDFMNGCSVDLLQSQFDRAVVDTSNKSMNALAGKPFQANYGIGGRCSILTHSEACGKDSYAYAEIECMGQAPLTDSFTTQPSAVWAFSWVMIFVGLCAIATILVQLDDLYVWYSTTVAAAPSQPAAGKSASDESTSLMVMNSNSENGAPDCTPTLTTGTAKRHLLGPAVLKFVSWFDLIGNFNRFTTVETRNFGNVDTRYFEGLRTIAMMAVVYGHTFIWPMVLWGYLDALKPWGFLKNYGSVGIFPAYLAVDTFFWLSGFLFMHLYMKAVEKKHVQNGGSVDDGDIRPMGIKETLLMYLHRYLRLTPVVMTTFIVGVWLLPYISRDTPYHRNLTENSMFKTCTPDGWWHQMLYIGNMNNKKGWESCLGWFWYLNCDMQLFLIAPILASLYYLHRGAYLMVMVSGVITGTALMGHYHGYTHQVYYMKTYMRFVPYLYGMACAPVLRAVDFNTILKSTPRRLLVYLIGTALLVSTINVMWHHESRLAEAAISGSYFAALEKMSHESSTDFMNAWATIAWGLGLNFFAAVWTTSHGGLIKAFLCHPVFAVLSKLTFTCYMVHPLVLSVHSVDSYHQPEFSKNGQYFNYFGTLSWAFTGALCLYLAVEYPLAMLNNWLTKRKK